MPLGLGTTITSSDAVSAAVDLNKSTPYTNTKSMEMDGVGDYFHAGFTQAEKESFFRDSFTISFWGAFNFDNNNWYAFGFDSTTGSPTSLQLRMLNLGAGNNWYPTGKFNNVSWAGSFLSNGLTGNKTTWVHIAMTMEKGASGSDNNTFKLYQNGTLLNSGGTAATTNTNMSATDFTGDVDIAFGGLVGTGGVNFNADMRVDEVAFFDAALDATTINAIYNSGSTFDLTSANGDYKSQANLVRYYRLEDNLTDSTGSSDGGTEGDPAFSSDTPDS